jgi:hypothetical protein
MKEKINKYKILCWIFLAIGLLGFADSATTSMVKEAYKAQSDVPEYLKVIDSLKIN